MIFTEYIVTLISLLLQAIGEFALVSLVVTGLNILVSGNRSVCLTELAVYRGVLENLLKNSRLINIQQE